MTRLPDRASRGGLEICVSQQDARFLGNRMQLARARIRLLRRLLCGDGLISFDDLASDLHFHAGVQGVRVHVHEIRKELRRAGAPVSVINVPGQGYHLQWEGLPMKDRLRNLARKFWPLAAVLVIGPALAQTNLTTIASPTRWTIEAVVDSAPTQSVPRSAANATSARTEAQAACKSMGEPLTSICLTKLKPRSFATLPANGPNAADYFIDVELNPAGGRHSYLVIIATRAP